MRSGHPQIPRVGLTLLLKDALPRNPSPNHFLQTPSHMHAFSLSLSLHFFLVKILDAGFGRRRRSIGLPNLAPTVSRILRRPEL